MLLDVKTVVLELCLLGTCCLGDYLLQHPVAKQRLMVAMVDSLTHGFVGGLSWAVVCDVQKPWDLVDCGICLLLAMMVDVDHFISAKSFSLKAALSLPSRPPFHASTIIIAVDVVLVLMSAAVKSKIPVLYGLMFTMAWLSHHVRDAVRRGMWFYPFGSTPPLPKAVYLAIVLTLPLLMGILYRGLHLKDIYKKVILNSVETV